MAYLAMSVSMSKQKIAVKQKNKVSNGRIKYIKSNGIMKHLTTTILVLSLVSYLFFKLNNTQKNYSQTSKMEIKCRSQTKTFLSYTNFMDPTNPMNHLENPRVPGMGIKGRPSQDFIQSSISHGGNNTLHISSPLSEYKATIDSTDSKSTKGSFQGEFSKWLRSNNRISDKQLTSDKTVLQTNSKI